MKTLKSNFKLVFTLLSLFMFTLSGLIAQNNTTEFEGDVDVDGTINSQQGIYSFKNTATISTGNTNGLLTYKSSHENIAQFILRNSTGDQVGRLFGNTASFGLRDRNGKWVLRAHEDFTELRAANTVAMILHNSGAVEIGNVDATPTGYKLFVEDGILAEKVRVALDGEDDWADYVFEDDYELMPLEEVDGFIKKNNHLPNVPSAEDMVESGLDVLESDAILLSKIEEAYLYIIEQNKKIKQQNVEITQQNNRISILEKQINN